MVFLGSGYLVNPNEKAFMLSARTWSELPKKQQKQALDIIHRNEYHLLVTYTPENKGAGQAIEKLSRNVQLIAEQEGVYRNKSELLERGFEPSRVICIVTDRYIANLFREENLKVCEIPSSKQLVETIQKFDALKPN